MAIDNSNSKKFVQVDSAGNFTPTLSLLNNTQNLTANNATANTPIFSVTGIVEVLRLWGLVTVLLGNNVTAAAYRLNDGTATSDITLNTGSNISSFSVGSGFWKRGLSTTALSIISASQERVNDPSAANASDFTPIILTQKTGSVTTNIEFVYTTTNTPTSGQIQHFIEYRPLSSNGAIVAV